MVQLDDTLNQSRNALDYEYRFSQSITKSPCYTNTISSTICQSYCDWHRTVIEKWNKGNFLNIMKYSVPARKLLPEDITQYEKYIIKRLYNRSHIHNDQSQVGPMALVLYCYDRIDGFEGDTSNLSVNLCNDFFPSPTDVGICLTKNMDINRIVHQNDDYHTLFEPQMQSGGGKFKAKTLWTEMKLVLYVDGSDEENDDNSLSEVIEREENANLNEVEFLIHPSDEFGKFLFGNDYDVETVPLKLHVGNEYNIDITPVGIIVSDEFKSLSSEKRGCVNENEAQKSKTFKVMNKNNCKYECHVKKAQGTCLCIPWDFLDNESVMPECDIFGRTCFFNAMKNLTRSYVDECPRCVENCERINFHMRYTEKSLSENKKELIDILEDSPNLFAEEGYKKAYNDIKDDITHGMDDFSKEEGTFEEEHSNRKHRMILINLRYLRPRTTSKSVKYTFLDKISNFGGKFGIFAQLTGCSLIAIFKIVLIMIKTLFSSYKNK